MFRKQERLQIIRADARELLLDRFKSERWQSEQIPLEVKFLVAANICWLYSNLVHRQRIPYCDEQRLNTQNKKFAARMFREYQAAQLKLIRSTEIIAWFATEIVTISWQGKNKDTNYQRKMLKILNDNLMFFYQEQRTCLRRFLDLNKENYQWNKDNNPKIYFDRERQRRIQRTAISKTGLIKTPKLKITMATVIGVLLVMLSLTSQLMYPESFPLAGSIAIGLLGLAFLVVAVYLVNKTPTWFAQLPQDLSDPLKSNLVTSFDRYDFIDLLVNGYKNFPKSWDRINLREAASKHDAKKIAEDVLSLPVKRAQLIKYRDVNRKQAVLFGGRVAADRWVVNPSSFKLRIVVDSQPMGSTKRCFYSLRFKGRPIFSRKGVLCSTANRPTLNAMIIGLIRCFLGSCQSCFVSEPPDSQLTDFCLSCRL